MTTTIADTVALFEEAKEAQPYLYFELAWTRQPVGCAGSRIARAAAR